MMLKIKIKIFCVEGLKVLFVIIVVLVIVAIVFQANIQAPVFPSIGDVVMFDGQEVTVMKCSSRMYPRRYIVRLSDYRTIEVIGTEIGKGSL